MQVYEILVLVAFAIGALLIAVGVFYACIMLVRNSVQLKRLERKNNNFVARQKIQTLIDIQSTCKDLRNATNNHKALDEATKELRRANENAKRIL